MLERTANQVSLMNTLLIALIMLVSLYLLRNMNNIGSINESYAEKCEPCNAYDTNDVRSEQIKMGLGNKDVDTVFGTPIAPMSSYSYENNQENAPDVGNGKKSLFLFKHTDCKPECCEFGKGTDVSCSGGCVCYDKEQNTMVSSRGDGVYPSKHESTMNLKPHQPILNDKWSN